MTLDRLPSPVKLTSPLTIRRSDLTIDGAGRCIWYQPIYLTGVHDVILCHFAHRLGSGAGRRDCIEAMPGVDGTRCRNVVIHDVSAAWGCDETISLYQCEQSTIQYCTLAYGLNANNHALAGIYSGNDVAVCCCRFCNYLYRPSVHGGRILISDCEFFNYSVSDPVLATLPVLLTIRGCSFENGPSTEPRWNSHGKQRTIRLMDSSIDTRLKLEVNSCRLHGQMNQYALTPSMVRGLLTGPDGLTAIDRPFDLGSPKYGSHRYQLHGFDKLDDRLARERLSRQGSIINHENQLGGFESL